MGVDITRADAVADSTIQTMKTLRWIRQHLPKPAAGVDHSAYPLLFVLAHEPARVSTVAERVGSEISTVSRQLGSVIEAGLATKVADPQDGRAALIELTPAGQRAIEQAREERARWFQSVLHEWTDDEVDHLLTALERFRQSMAAATPSSVQETA